MVKAVVTPSKILVAIALLGLLAAVPLVKTSAHADGRSSRPDVMPVSAIKPGMKGYGLTVFEGTEPTRFDVEVIDVLKNFRPDQDLILVKTKHPRLEVAKVVAGMSGSPVYLEGKMIGAYAYGWTFGEEPIAGVTPIRNMLDDLARPLPKVLDGIPLDFVPKVGAVASAAAAAGNAGAGTDAAAYAQFGPGSRYAGAIAAYDLKQHAQQLSSLRSQGIAPGGPIAPVSTPLLIGGMTGGSIELATELFGPLGLVPLQAGGGGGTDPAAPKRFVDGGAIGVELVRGDMSATGLGTVTRVEGDRLVGFGHPMMGSGVSNLPTAVGKVLWFLASSMRSFKIGMPVRPLGALVNDRQASIVVSQTAKAPVIPVKVRIRGVPGAPRDEWNFEVAHEKFMTSSFMAIALGSALQTTAGERQDVSYNAVSKLKLRGFPELTLEDYGVAVGGTPEPRDFIRSNLVSAVGALMNNPWQPLVVESVSMDIELRYARELYRLRGAEVIDPMVYAGQTARVRLTFVPFNGPVVEQVVTIPIPKHFAGQTLRLEIRPGYLVTKPKASPDSLNELVHNFEDPTYPAKSVVLSYAAGDAVAYRGLLAENLPPGALDALRPSSATIAPEAYRSTQNIVTLLKEFMIGADTVAIDVKPVLN